jgi:RNA polymerase sigma-70 factor (ECF subfamily)
MNKVSDGVPQHTWESLVSDHAARTYRLAYRLTGNVYDAEDLTQETFVRVFRSLSTYRDGSLEGWFHRITVNLYLDMVRRRARLRFEPLGDYDSLLPDPEACPDRHWEMRNLDTDIQAALDALAPDFRVAVVLSDVEGYSYAEIAAILGVKNGTVRSRIHRARTQLRATLAHRAPATAPSLVGSKT